MKTGEIAISVVVVIALGLIVLISLAVLLVDSTGDARAVTDACEETYGGVCMSRTACLDNGGRVVGGVSCQSSFTTEFSDGWSVDSLPVGGGSCCVQ